MTQEALAVESPTGTLARAREGDHEAFAGLVRQHQRMVYSIVWNFFADRSAAEDLSQDVFVQLFQNLRAIESDSHLVFWLRQVTSRKCIDYTRRYEHKHKVNLDDVVEFAPQTRTNDAAPDFLETQRLKRLVAGLPKQLRAVVLLRYQEEMQPTEIAQALGCPVNSVKSRLHRALRMLRARLEQ